MVDAASELLALFRTYWGDRLTAAIMLAVGAAITLWALLVAIVAAKRIARELGPVMTLTFLFTRWLTDGLVFLGRSAVRAIGSSRTIAVILSTSTRALVSTSTRFLTECVARVANRSQGLSSTPSAPRPAGDYVLSAQVTEFIDSLGPETMVEFKRVLEQLVDDPWPNGPDKIELTDSIRGIMGLEDPAELPRIFGYINPPFWLTYEFENAEVVRIMAVNWSYGGGSPAGSRTTPRDRLPLDSHTH